MRLHLAVRPGLDQQLLLVDAHLLERAPVGLHVTLDARARAVGAVARVEQVVEAQAFARSLGGVDGPHALERGEVGRVP